jgi:hypothetical protein
MLIERGGVSLVSFVYATQLGVELRTLFHPFLNMRRPLLSEEGIKGWWNMMLSMPVFQLLFY